MKKSIFIGIALCLLLSVPSYFLGTLVPVVGGPVFAILLGMLVGLVIKNRTYIQNGITFTSKKILQYAVILLGFGMNITQVLATGKESLPIIITTITVALVTGYVVSKIFNIVPRVATLISVGSSICGGSAIAASAPVIGASDEEIAQSISVVFLFNVLAALIFPTLGDLIGISNEGFGIFAGTAVNDTSSVTAAATAWDGIHGSNTLEIATIVKLTRTLAIIPITIALAFIRSNNEKKHSQQEANGSTSFHILKIFPFFILYFLLASIITTVFNLSPTIIHPLRFLSKFFIIMAMTAIGLNTNIIKLIKTGGKPILLGFICWMCVSISSLFMQYILNIW